MVTLKFTIDGKLPNLNDYIGAMNRNRHVGNKMKQENQQLVCWAIVNSELHQKAFRTPVQISYHFYEPNMRRDPDNVEAFARKVINDALQQMGVIANDNWKGISSHSTFFDVDKENPRIEVFITGGI